MSPKVKIKVYVDSDIWEAFKNYVFQKYGTLHKYLGDELSRAIDEYLTHSRPAHTQALEHILSKPNKRHLQILIWLLKTHPYEVLYSEIRQYIIDNFGSDHRTVKKYLHEFLISGGFVEIKKSLRGNTEHILKVNAEKIYRYLTNYISEEELRKNGIHREETIPPINDETAKMEEIRAYALERYESGDTISEIKDKLIDFGLDLSKKAVRAMLRKAKMDIWGDGYVLR